MKRFLKMRFTKILTVFLAFALCSCTWLGNLTPTQSDLIKRAVRLAGITICFENQGDIEDLIEKAHAVLNLSGATVKEAALKELYSYIYGRYGHNAKTTVILAEVNDLLGAVFKDNQLEFLDEFDLDGADQFIIAFVDGLSLATPRYGKFIRQ